MKKTALDDDAYLYQKHEKKTEKQKWEEMNTSQRKQYFLDYYLWKLVLLAAVIFTVGFLIWHFFVKPEEETILYVAVVDEALDEEKLDAFTMDLTEYLGADGKRKTVRIDDSFYMKDGALDKLEVYLHSRQIDVVIADEDTYRELAGYGFFQDIDTILGDGAEKYEPLYIKTAGYRDSDEVSFEDTETARGEELHYGVDIGASEKFNSMKEYLNKPVLAIVQEAKNTENAVKFLDFIME